MPYDLRFEPWLPWRRKSRRFEWGAPSLVTDRIGDDPVVALACPRPDFDAAVKEFLIGLFSVALAPKDEAVWRRLWDAPPSPADLEAALRRLPEAFYLDGDGPRAFQDLDALIESEPNDITALLIDAPGENTAKFNKDLFVRRSVSPTFGRPAAAMALIALQTYAPAGGQGNRTSMRGGGPMTTLVEPRADAPAEPVWRLLWANAETEDQLYERDRDKSRKWGARDRYPWMAPTRTSNPKQSGAITAPVDAEPAQAYFAMPRRVRLDFLVEPGVCALTGRQEASVVASYRARNFGVDYEHWLHPLSPYYRDGDAWRPLHPQPGGIGWKDWLGLLAVRPEAGRAPASVVAHFAARRAKTVGLRQFRISAFGYDMDNMKARGWADAEMPAFPADVVERQRLFAERCVAGADQAARLLVGAAKQGWFDNPKDAPGDFSPVRQALWNASEQDFFELTRRLAEAPDSFEPGKAAMVFAKTLRTEAMAAFDAHCPLDCIEHGRMQRPIAARHALHLALSGYGKAGESFCAALELPRPDAHKSKSAKESA